MSTWTRMLPREWSSLLWLAILAAASCHSSFDARLLKSQNPAQGKRKSKLAHNSSTLLALISPTLIRPRLHYNPISRIDGSERRCFKQSLRLSTPCWRLIMWRGLESVLNQSKIRTGECSVPRFGANKTGGSL